jgi:hypothetical protein
MTEDKTAGLLFALGLNDPEHKGRAAKIVEKIVDNRFKVHQIATDKGLHPSKLAVDKGLTISKLATDKGFSTGKIATDKGLTIGKLSSDKGMSLKDLADEEEKKLWLDHVDKIAKKHRNYFGTKNEHLPPQISANVKMTCVKLFKKHHEDEIRALVEKIKKAKATPKQLASIKAVKSTGKFFKK